MCPLIAEGDNSRRQVQGLLFFGRITSRLVSMGADSTSYLTNSPSSGLVHKDQCTSIGRYPSTHSKDWPGKLVRLPKLLVPKIVFLMLVYVLSMQWMGTVKSIQYERSIACRKLCMSIASLLLYLERQLCVRKDIPWKSSRDGMIDDLAALWGSIPHFWIVPTTRIMLIIFCACCRITSLRFLL